jgi:tricorn protease
MHRLAMLALFASVLCLADQSAPLLLQKPTLSRTHIVFNYAGDLWSVPREGGDALRLTTAAGIESNPKFSPDGTQIAFTGEYDGNVDVFVMPATGGVPKRLTWHPAPDNVLGWTPDGKRILFSSTRSSYSRFAELYTVSPQGGLEEKLPLPMGFEAGYSPDGTHLAYLPVAPAFRSWKHYRGGETTPIWIANLADSHVEKVPRDNSNDFNPMWIGDKIYFLSDRDNGPITLYCYDTRSKSVKRVLENNGLDLKSASAAPDAIVYEQFGAIHLFDLKSGKSKPVNVRVAGDMPEVREHFVNVAKRLRNGHLSPNGARAVFEARGEIITVPAEKGDPRNLTNTPSAMERDPAWSPDGKTIAYFSDESGEYALHLRAQNGMGDVTRIKLDDKPSFYYLPRWSPDSKKISYIDNHMNAWYVDVDQKKPVKVDTAKFPSGRNELAPVWSPDGKWLAYAKDLQNQMGAVYLYSVADGKSTQVTDGMSDAGSPVFDKDGKYLYFLASTDSGPAHEADLHSFTRNVTSSVYLMVLAKDQPSPLGPESDDEKVADEKKDDAAKDGAKKDEPKKDDPAKAGAKVAVKVDFDNIGQRILAVPMPPRRYAALQVGKAGVLFALEVGAFVPGPEPPGATVHRFDLKTRKSDVAIGGVRAFEISSNGEKMLYRQGDKWTIAAPRPMASGSGPAPSGPPPGGADGVLKTDALEVRIDPRAEWKQMYHESFRIEREFFYDPNAHGLDLRASEKKYAPYLENLAARVDLNYIFAEVYGDLTVGHLYIFGGEQPDVKRVQTGLLGADYKLENGRYRFARVYDGENWNPQLKAPLTQPGVNVAAGDYLLAVDGRDVRASDNVYSFFEGTSGKSVLLKVGPDPAGANSREVTVVPVPSETALRNLAWIEGNRRKVDQMTNGKVAYIYMPDTAFGGLTNFNRYFFAQVGKEAAIIDERFNGGGALATDIIEYLKRPLMSMASGRDGADFAQPLGIYGPKVMVINEFAGSGGDAMPWYFKREGVGKLVGKRTWGGLVGIGGTPDLMDGGLVTAPGDAIWNTTTLEYDIENHGMAPDIEVDFDPELVRKGQDPQLDKAVQVVLEELKLHPAPHPVRPAYPNHHQKAVSTK